LGSRLYHIQPRVSCAEGHLKTAEADRTGWRSEDFYDNTNLPPNVIDPWDPGSVKEDNRTSVTIEERIFHAPHQPSLFANAGHRYDFWDPTGPSTPQPCICTATDPWNPPTRRDQPFTASIDVPKARLEPSEAAAPSHLADPWNPSEQRVPDEFKLPIDNWFLDASLPVFDPAASRAKWSVEDFVSPQKRDARHKAKWIVAILHPQSNQQRARWLNAFEEVFTGNSSDRFFLAVRRVANGLDSAEALLNAIELRELWEDRSDFQRARSSKWGAKMLSLPNALRIAKARDNYFVPDMIAADWVEEWQRLRPTDRGYWSFAEYAVHQAERAGYEDWQIARDRRHEERVWLRGYADPISSSGVSVQTGRRRHQVPAAIVKRYGTWRETQESAPPQRGAQQTPDKSGVLDEQLVFDYVATLVNEIVGSSARSVPELVE
jgi:hypothetical protein